MLRIEKSNPSHMTLVLVGSFQCSSYYLELARISGYCIGILTSHMKVGSCKIAIKRCKLDADSELKWKTKILTDNC